MYFRTLSCLSTLYNCRKFVEKLVLHFHYYGKKNDWPDLCQYWLKVEKLYYVLKALQQINDYALEINIL